MAERDWNSAESGVRGLSGKKLGEKDIEAGL